MQSVSVHSALISCTELKRTVYLSYSVKVLIVADYIVYANSGLLGCVIILYYDVSKNPVTFTFRVKHSPRKVTLLGLLGPEGEVNRILCCVENYLPDNVSSQKT